MKASKDAQIKTQYILPSEKFSYASQIVNIFDGQIPVSVIPVSGMKVSCLNTKKDYILGEELGVGGEGAVYRVNNAKGIVCKIYKAERLMKAKIAKLRLMVSKKISDPGICWPIDIVTNKNGEPVGYIMPEAEGKVLQKFQNQYFLTQAFPKWKKADLVDLACTIAEKIKILHDRNVIIGDINTRNIMVKSSKEVFFVDCDSYQVEGFPCPVGTNEFIAKEILESGKRFDEFLRTIGNENFGVAVLFFTILMNGKHPYSSIGGADTVTNIKTMKFPYGFRSDTEFDLVIPRGNWKMIWEYMPERMRELFYNTFSIRGKFSREATRQSIDVWLDALQNYRRSLEKRKKKPENLIFPGLDKIDKKLAKKRKTPITMAINGNYTLDKYMGKKKR